MHMRVKPYLIIRTLKQNGLDVDKTAKQLCMHRSTIYRWIKKARSLHQSNMALSEKGLVRKSTRPYTIKRALSAQEETNAVTLRVKKKYTAEKVKKKLNLSCHPKTLHRIFLRYNLVGEYGKHRRPRFQNTIHMHLKNTTQVGFLQMDVKYLTPELTGLPCKPVFIQTDNGLEFQGRFKKFVEGLKLNHHHIHKRTPNENAVIERSFRTDEEEFLFRLEEFLFRLDQPPKHYDELRLWFAEWIREYNYERPHLGIDLKTPYEVVANVLSD